MASIYDTCSANLLLDDGESNHNRVQQVLRPLSLQRLIPIPQPLPTPLSTRLSALISASIPTTPHKITCASRSMLSTPWVTSERIPLPTIGSRSTVSMMA